MVHFDNIFTRDFFVRKFVIGKAIVEKIVSGQMLGDIYVLQ